VQNQCMHSSPQSAIQATEVTAIDYRVHKRAMRDKSQSGSFEKSSGDDLSYEMLTKKIVALQ
jgi:hypothetical protein